MQGTERTRIRAICLGSAILAAILLFAATPAFAADDYYLKLDGVTGESKEIHHVGWIVITGYDMNAANSSSGTSTGTGAGVGKPVTSMSVTKRTDNTSSILLSALTTGKHFKTATIEAVKAGDQNRVSSTTTMQNVQIGAFHQSAASSGQVDTMTLQFTSIATTQASQSPDGRVATPQVTTKRSSILRKDVAGKVLKSP